MSGLEIGLLAFGLICFVVSFFLSEKLSSSDIKEFEKVSKADINAIVEKQLREANDGITRMIDDGMKDAMEDFDGKADRLLNTKIISISDYSDSVLQSIEKSHKEVVFMYNMLLQKQEDLTNLTEEIATLQANLRNIKANFEEQVKNGEYEYVNAELEKLSQDENVGKIYEQVESVNVAPKMEEAFSNQVVANDQNQDNKNNNEIILKMHSEGFSEVEIAKRLGKGLGEIKLVLGLFNKD